MDEWKQEYIHGVKRNKIPENLFNDTLQKIELITAKQDRRKYRAVSRRIAIATCFIIGILVIVPTVSYAAYGVNIFELLANRSHEVKNGGGVSIGIPTNTKTYVYDGEVLEIPYELTGSGISSISGMLLLVDGIPQPYRIKMEGKIASEEEYLHVFDVTETGKAEFSFVFTPVRGKDGDQLSLNFVQINNPEYQPVDETYIGYDLSGMSFASNPVTIDCKKDTSNPTEYLPYEATWTRATRTNETLSSETEAGYFVAKNGIVDFVISLNGEKEGKYRTVLYLNNKPIQIESKDYLEGRINAGESMTCNVAIDVSNYDRINTVYAVTTLVEDEKGAKVIDIAEKSSSTMVINDLKEADYADQDNAETQKILDNVPKGGSELIELTKLLPNINCEIETIYLGKGIYLYIDDNSNLCKYDVNRNEILETSESNLITADNRKLYVLNSGYAIKYETFAEDAVKIVFYNDTLEETKTVDASDLMERDQFSMNDPVTLSSDGRYLSYVNYYREGSYGALFLYDLEKNEKKQICKLYNEYPETIKGNLYIYSLQFSKDNQLLYYVGSKYLTEEKQVDGIGAISIDGNNMKFYEANVNQDFLLSDQYAMFFDGLLPGNQKGSGIVATMDSLGELSGYELKSKNESQQVYVSEEGNLFVTVERTELSNNPPYILRAYDAKTGKLLMEQQANFEGYDLSQMMQMIIMEDENAFVVYYRLGTEGATEEAGYELESKAMIYKY
ncbi:MAG: hypothetical protein WBI07_02285 [Mobilitalea sp.]